MAWANYEYNLAPPWLRKRWGRRWLTAFGGLKDGVEYLTVLATKARIIRTAPVDALRYIGVERDLERYPSETDEQYRERLEAAWPAYEQAGTDLAVVEQLGVLGLTAGIRRDRQWKHDGHEPGDVWARMWVLLTEIPWPIVETYSDLDAKYGSYAAWGAAKVGWGIEAPLDEIARITRIVRKWTASHILLVNIIAISRGRVFGYPDVATYSDLPADTYASYVAYWDGF